MKKYKCKACQKFKNPDEFYKNQRHKNGLATNCIQCTLEYNKDWQRKNAGRRKAYRDRKKKRDKSVPDRIKVLEKELLNIKRNHKLTKDEKQESYTDLLRKIGSLSYNNLTGKAENSPVLDAVKDKVWACIGLG